MEKKEILFAPLKELKLLTRTQNVLRIMKIENLFDLAQQSKQELLKCKNFGNKSLNELDDLLATQGLRWNMTVTELAEVIGISSSEIDSSVVKLNLADLKEILHRWQREWQLIYDRQQSEIATLMKDSTSKSRND